jgi:AcrR family transcriptional regulator
MAVARKFHPAPPRTGRRRARGAKIAAIQRKRMLTAAIEAVQENGYAGLTVAQVTARARVSRKTFYELFTDREDCFLAAFEQTLERTRLLVGEAYAEATGWREGVRAALARILELIEDEPALAKLCIVETLGAGEAVRRRRAEVLSELAEVIDRGRLLSSVGREPPAVTAEGVVGGIVAVLHARQLVTALDGPPLGELLGPLTSTIALPYLGAKAARRELDRPVTRTVRKRPVPQAAPRSDPLEGLNMRLTYRTVQVLAVIAEHTGASNREVAAGSGIVDQGQISKLLNRLAGLELIENRGAGVDRGAANAWWLTPRGAQIERASRARP